MTTVNQNANGQSLGAARVRFNGDRVRALYEKAGCDDPEDQGVYAILDYEWRRQREVQCRVYDAQVG